MPRGGKRPGAGKPKGAKNKLTQGKEGALEQAKAVLGDGLDPLTYMLQVMRSDAVEVDTRLEAAKSAAPYVHKKMPVDVSVDAKNFPLPPPLVLVINAGADLPDDLTPQ